MDNIKSFLTNPQEYINNINDLIISKREIEQVIDQKMLLLNSEQLRILNKQFPQFNINTKKYDVQNVFVNLLTKKFNKYISTDIEEILYLIVKLLFIDNLLNNGIYNKLFNYDKILSIPTVNVRNNPIIIEESDTNFGHIDLVWNTNITLPTRKELLSSLAKLALKNNYNTSNNVIYGGTNNYNISNNVAYENIELTKYFSQSIDKIFDKQEIIESEYYKGNIKPINGYFKLYKYTYDDDLTKSYIHTNQDHTKPTFSISLFMPNNKINELKNDKIDRQPKLGEWFKRYLFKQIKQAIVISYLLPESNYRNYFDYYMMKFFENDNTDINIEKYKDVFISYEFDISTKNIINNVLSSFVDFVKNKRFNNNLERILYYYDIATRFNYNNGNPILANKRGDFFIYKLGDTFIENKGTDTEGHITNGYIGQHMRYISLKQQDYTYNNILIKRPQHLIWRDAHTNTTGRYDAEWIREVNKLNGELYLLPDNFQYNPLWHDYVKRKYKNEYIRRSAIAGVVQMINKNNTNTWLNNLIYLQSIGLAFIINTNINEPIIKNHRPYQLRNPDILKEYEYGIDEYILSSLFVLDYYKSKSLYFNDKFIIDINPYNYWRFGYPNKIDSNVYEFKYDINEISSKLIIKVTYLLIIYLQSINKIDYTFEIIDFINKVEELRNIPSLKNNKTISLLLSIYPTKYLIQTCIFDNGDNIVLFNKNFRTQDIINAFMEFLKIKGIPYTGLNEQLLKDIGIDCNKTIINSPLEWDISDHLKETSLYKNCDADNFYSGFYFDNPPALDIGILRKPTDLIYTVNSLNNNNLKIKLNKSDYKLTVENETLQKIIGNTIDINSIILKNILVDKETIFNNMDDLLKSKIIWRTLNYSGFDIPSTFFKIDDYPNISQINNIVKSLSYDKEFVNMIMFMLIQKDTNITKDNYKSYPQYSIFINNINQYKMASYKKYLKYKQKYLALKNNI